MENGSDKVYITTHEIVDTAKTISDYSPLMIATVDTCRKALKESVSDSVKLKVIETFLYSSDVNKAMLIING